MGITLIFWNLLEFLLAWNVLYMFHVGLKRMCILLLESMVIYRYVY